jgi:hypothetical protein
MATTQIKLKEAINVEVFFYLPDDTLFSSCPLGPGGHQMTVLLVI